MLHVAKENFITNERFHPDAIAQVRLRVVRVYHTDVCAITQAHLAFADEKGLDCPECALLAEQFAAAVDRYRDRVVVVGGDDRVCVCGLCAPIAV
jgi:hypothetical protein